MKTLIVGLVFAMLPMVAIAAAQDVVPLYTGTPPGSTQQNYPEKQYFSKAWNEDVVANVTRPTQGRPAFAAVIYGGMIKDAPVPVDGPPMFIAAATDDQLGLAPGSVTLYQKWTAASKPAELHMYAKGGHGFGMKKQNLPTDNGLTDFRSGCSWGVLSRTDEHMFAKP